MEWGTCTFYLGAYPIWKQFVLPVGLNPIYRVNRSSIAPNGYWMYIVYTTRKQQCIDLQARSSDNLQQWHHNRNTFNNDYKLLSCRVGTNPSIIISPKPHQFLMKNHFYIPPTWYLHQDILFTLMREIIICRHLPKITR